ncbi:hypothetical protein [Streptomyces sp. NPDC059788]|uniref:hypothetical protein n=1 Tax=Streptomyces sp. NPDC059788 TaxID=3346948 RepID=UPI00365D35A1
MRKPTEPPLFDVLLGPDHAGKSSVVHALAEADPSRCLVSADGALLAPEHSLIRRLRRDLFTDVTTALGTAYSLDFMATVMQTAVVHLRDQVLRAPRGRPVLVDSYYYKILAKCRLAGLDDSPLYAWWRSFPQPRSVVYLDVSPRTAWLRSGEGAEANDWEYYGDRAGPEAFESYQSDLHRALLQEIAHLPVNVVHEQDGVAQTVGAVRKALHDDVD